MSDENEKKHIFHPIINGLQKMALYTTRSRCYLIGSNNTQTKFRVLKIDRTEPHDLVLTDDDVEYSQSEIKDLLLMIGGGNKIPLRTTTATKASTGVTRTVSAFGIFGFIRFLEGYYIILITKRRKVAVIGHHSIYKVEDTSIIYIPHESVRKLHEDEYKYFKLLNNIDLTSNFYFSYSFDLTNSLQYNMSSIKNLKPNLKDFSESFMNDFDAKSKAHKNYSYNIEVEKEQHFGVWTIPAEKFVWNSYLLEPLKKKVHPCWVLPITQGFVAQSNISVYGRSFFLTLIARRSSKYAGTRFLKRGANCEGDVANEVETEQIVHDAHISSLVHGRFTSFVQIRGSIPCHWSQDISKMVPKPPITIDVWDPYAETAGKHFNQLLKRFGSPVIVLNLVKRREKKPHESLLNEEYTRLIQQLNVSLPPVHKIHHVAVDMARINKDKKENVMSRLADIAYRCIKKTGIFQSASPYYVHEISPDPQNRKAEKGRLEETKNFGARSSCPLKGGRFQTGVIRVNCVDCLDRTNTAQFCLGKCALAFQLYCLGVLENPSIEFDSACVRMLEEMYEDHGDTLALQYGGSQLVHRIATYRKTAPWSSHGNDIMQSLSRYLSNTFSDQEKQQAINLFLGVFVPLEQFQPLWDMTSDYLLHHSLARTVWPCHRKNSSQWWEEGVMQTLPLPCDQVNRKAVYLIPLSPFDPRIDLYQDFYRPFEFSVMSECYTRHMNHSSSYLDGNDMTQMLHDESPFSVHGLPAKANGSSPIKRFSLKSTPDSRKSHLSFPGITSSAPSNSSSGASSTETEATNEELSEDALESDNRDMEETKSKPPSFASLFAPIEENYGTIFTPIPPSDMGSYERFASIKNQISPKDQLQNQMYGSTDSLRFELTTSFSFYDAYEIQPPTVSEFSLKAYDDYVSLRQKGPVPPKHKDLLKYQMFVAVS